MRMTKKNIFNIDLTYMPRQLTQSYIFGGDTLPNLLDQLHG